MRRLLTACTTILLGLSLQGCFASQTPEQHKAERATEDVTVVVDNFSWKTVNVTAFSVGGEKAGEIEQLGSQDSGIFLVDGGAITDRAEITFQITWTGGRNTLMPAQVKLGSRVYLIVKNRELSAVQFVTSP